MRIAIDARAISHAQPGGFKTYTTNLVRALLEWAPTNEYVLYLDRPLTNGMLSRYANASQEVIRPTGGWAGVPLREQIRLPLHLHRQRPDVVHFPCATAPVLPTWPLVITIHDTIEFFEKPHLSRPLREGLRRILMALYNRCVQRIVARRATLAITVSTHSKSDIAKILRVPEHKIRVIPNAPAECYRPCQDANKIKALRDRYELPDSFVLALVSASPRKNASGLLRIYAQLPTALRHHYSLVMVWTHPLLQARVKETIRRLGLTGCVQFLSHIPDKDLVLLYNAAALFIFPSLYEGFGLPVLEAMACGTPVVASNLTSIPEVTGDAAELADPRDETAFAQALIDVLRSPERQTILAEAGLQRVRQFSWQRAARMTLDVYREVVADRASS